MKLQHVVLIVLSLCFAAVPVVAQADTLTLPEGATKDDLKPDFPQPYIVKKGDTLWDIAEHFFKDPYKWIKIWEKNLYISNPDLIYPGNEIWFSMPPDKVKVTSPAQPRVIKRVQPAAIIKPVEKIEPPIDPNLFLTALARQDFIQPKDVDGVGHILDSEDGRLYYGNGDRIYLKFKHAANPGELFDVFRTGDVIKDPKNGRKLGVLVHHLGQVKVISEDKGIYRGMITNSFEEMDRGNRLKPAKIIDGSLKPSFPAGDVSGQVLYIRNNAAEAGQNQVTGISLGIKDGMTPGMKLSVHRAGRVVRDKVTGKKTRLPEEKIGELLVLVPQRDASIALVTKSTAAINLGDAVRNQASR